MSFNAFWTNATIDLLLVIFVIDCCFMGLVIMMQRSKQEGLGAAFGGGFTDSIWGAQTSQVLVKATVYAAIIFFVVSICLARLYSHRAALIVPTGSGVQSELEKTAAVPAKTAPVTNAAPLVQPVPVTSAATQVAPTNTATGTKVVAPLDTKKK